jgi:hypothetical protein
LYCCIQDFELVIKFLHSFYFCQWGDVSKAIFQYFHQLCPISQPKVLPQYPCGLWCMYIDLCDDQVVVCLDWSCCILCVTLCYCIHEACAEHIVNSGVVACAV